MIVGLDVGYSHTRGVSEKGRVKFASVIGTPDRARFSLNGASEGIILASPRPVLVGDVAVIQSRQIERREDREWIESDAYHDLVLAAFTEVTTATHVDLVVVSGQPVRFYARDRPILRDRLLGDHTAARDGRRRQTFSVSRTVIMTQGFGALLSVCLDRRGNVTDPEIANGRIGLIDVGGKTTNLLSVSRLAEVGRETASVNTGAWDVVRAVERWLADHCPGLELRDHALIDAIRDRQVRYYGDTVDLRDAIDEAISPLADQVIAQTTQLWNGGANLDAILVAGGGAHLVGPYIGEHFRHARVVAGDPVFANAEGYYRFAHRIARG
ncbi:MAG: ParM/StbA family protein [Anaerolineae bacterium]|nr:ParM/StbA family protein [Anaerolineae bacterium]